MEKQEKPVVEVIAPNFRSAKLFAEKYLAGKSIESELRSDMHRFELEDFIVLVKPVAKIDKIIN